MSPENAAEMIHGVAELGHVEHTMSGDDFNHAHQVERRTILGITLAELRPTVPHAGRPIPQG